MKTRAVRMYGANDLRLEEFDLPPIKDDEILVKVISDSICMSTYKAVNLGAKHKRVPKDIMNNPIIVGHEFAGIIVEVGKKWQHQFKAGQKFAQQPALNYKGSPASPGYSYCFFGGNATYAIIPHEVMELGCLLPYEGESFFEASLGEPMSCIVGAFHAQYHTKPGNYQHQMGIIHQGNMAILAGAGPMGMGAIDYALQLEYHPKILVVTDQDNERLNRAKDLFSDKASNLGVKLLFINTTTYRSDDDLVKELLNLTDGYGFDDVFVYAPVKAVVELGDKILSHDGCLNFFAGPIDEQFSALINFYNVHYGATHLVGTSGGNIDDLLESLKKSTEKKINPAVMLTHIGGIDATIESILNLPNIKGGKKMIYNHINLPLTAIDDIVNQPQQDSRMKKLKEILTKTNGIWCSEAEHYLLEVF